MRVNHTQNLKSHKHIHDSRHNYRNHATVTRITPQLYDSRHNYTIHATITRFTPQSQESRYKVTADQSWAQNSLNSLFPAFFREHMKEAPNPKMAENGQWQCVHCGEALQDIFNFCPECGRSVAQDYLDIDLRDILSEWGMG